MISCIFMASIFLFLHSETPPATRPVTLERDRSIRALNFPFRSSRGSNSPMDQPLSRRDDVNDSFNNQEMQNPVFFARFHWRCRHLCQPPPRWVLRNYRCLKMAMTVMMRKPLCCRQISGAFATPLQSMFLAIHSSILDSNHHRKQPPKKWNEEEDERLRSAVQKYGEAKWKDIAKYIPYERLLPPCLLHCFVCTCRNT